jgi:hypothetical protein
LLTKNRISEAEQSRAFIRGFQPDLWRWISRRLEIKLPDHDPDNFYSLFRINEAAKHVLHGTPQNSFLQNSVTSPAPPTQLASPYIKAEDLSMLFEQMAQSFLKVLTLPKSTTNHAGSSTNAQATMLDLLSCAFCSQTGHFIAQCLVCVDYITNEKCKRNPEGKIVLPNGQYTPRTNTQATTLDPLSCAFCSQTSHFIAQCLVCADYITNEKCKRNPEGKIVLPNGQ